MAIMRCPECGKRISDRAAACPYCDAATGEMSAEDMARMVRRRWRARLYRARNLTYIAMGLVMLGALWWWFTPPQGLALPLPVVAGILMGVGLVVYLAGWAWIVWLRLPSSRPPPG